MRSEASAPLSHLTFLQSTLKLDYMPVSADQIKHFRVLGHNLKPVVMIAGNGLSPSVLAEIERALDDHELIKVKIALEDREERKALISELVLQVNAELIQTIGKIALIFRAARKPKMHTSNIR
jgi:RNA-binding protein